MGAAVIGPTGVYVVAEVTQLWVYFAMGDQVPETPVVAQAR